MADTRQVVKWSLEQTCPFRKGENWYLPQETSTQLFHLETLDRALREQRILDGICVTSWDLEFNRDGPGIKRQTPSGGFLVKDLAGDYGDLTKVQSTCEACVANASAGQGTKVAGCHGTFDVDPDSQELEALLRRIVQEHQIETSLKAAFQETDPLWYSFWIESPMKPHQMELLREILSTAASVDDSQVLQGHAHFLEALNRSLASEIPLHVILMPRGHVDFGFYTVFPHCPRCRASTPVKRWQTAYPKDTYRCEVCGAEYIPNEHQSTTRMELDWNPINLKRHLGPEGYEDFLRRFQDQRG